MGDDGPDFVDKVGGFALVFFIFTAFISGVGLFTQPQYKAVFTSLQCPFPILQTGWDRTNCSHPPVSRGPYTEALVVWNVSLVGSQWCFCIPIGYVDYAKDFFQSGLEHVTGFFSLFALIITPIGFNIVGYTFTDLSQTGQAFVIAFYGFMYLGIGALILKYIGRIIEMIKGLGSSLPIPVG